MTDLPLVSVVIPVYNDEQYIAEAINSVLMQNYANLELIVIDDGSTDKTPDIILTFGNRVRFIRQKNAGSAVARNRGIQEATGKYIAFNDSDDLWAPNRLQQQVEFIENNPEYDAVCGVDVWVEEDFTLASVQEEEAKSGVHQVELLTESSGWHYLTILKKMPYHIINLMLSRELAKKLSFNPDLRRGQDLDYWLQLSRQTQIAHINQVYGYYRQLKKSISHRPHKRNYRLEIISSAISRFGITDMNGKSITQKELKNIFYGAHFSHGYELFHAKWYKRALKSFSKAIYVSPFKIGGLRYLIMSLFLFAMDAEKKYS